MQGPVRVRIRHADGSWRYLEAFGNNLHRRTRPSRGVVSRPATSPTSVEAEEALRRSDERFRALVQNLSDVITIVGPGGQLVYSSPAAETGCSASTEGDESWTDPHGPCAPRRPRRASSRR